MSALIIYMLLFAD